MSRDYCVIGSINMDLVAGVERFPAPGETLTGTSFGTFPGGKGANQAVALARLGARVQMAGMVGRDMFGEQYLKNFSNQGVDASLVESLPDIPTGVAVIEVDAAGENHIVIVPGANRQIDEAYIERTLSGVNSAELYLLQLEIPMAPILCALQEIKKRNAKVILDPAPVPDSPLPEELYSLVDIVTPNEHEAELLTGIKVKDAVGAERAGRILLGYGAGTVIIKAGGKGAFIVSPEGVEHIAATPVDVVDSTGAGDSFNAGLAFALGEGRGLQDAVKFATVVGGLACTGFGAQSSMPDLEQVKARLS